MDQESFRALVRDYVRHSSMKVAAKQIGVHEKYLYRWLQRPELSGPRIAAYFGYWPVKTKTITYETRAR